MAIDKIQSESINLADTFAFTGTVTGAGGITLADQWHITASLDAGNSNTDTVITNWTQDGYGEDGRIGTMSESSGIFTFHQQAYTFVNLLL
ncbi:hypothetical protein, partial [uncultured phage MedDCM-OCT-S04-C136]